MSLARVTYTTTTNPQTLAIPFPYLTSDHVIVSFGGVVQTEGVGYTFVTSSSISVSCAVDTEVEIRRSTSLETRLTNYIDGTLVNANPLNIDSKQPFYLIQEIDDTLDEIVSVIDGGGGSTIQTGITVADDGVALGTTGTVNVLDFNGKGVEASRVDNQVTVDIPAPGGFTFDTSPPAIATVDDGHRFVDSATFKQFIAVNDGTSRQWVEVAGGASEGALESHTHDVGDITNLSEAIDDRVGSLLVAGTGVTLTYDDAANTLTIDATGGAGAYLPLAGGTLTGDLGLAGGVNIEPEVVSNNANFRVKPAVNGTTNVIIEPTGTFYNSSFVMYGYDYVQGGSGGGTGDNTVLLLSCHPTVSLTHLTIDKVGVGTYARVLPFQIGSVNSGSGPTNIAAHFGWNTSDGSDPYVAIGGTTRIADAKLQVNGDCNITGNLKLNGTTFTPPSAPPKVIQVAASDVTTAITAGTAKVTFRMPYAMTLSAVRASLGTAQTSGSIFTVDINEGGSSILATKLTIDNTETTSTTAATAAVISDTSLADDAEITIDVDQVGDGTAKQLIVTLIGT